MTATLQPDIAHRLLTALMVERAGGPPVIPAEHPRFPPVALRAARRLPLIGSFVDPERRVLVIDLDETYRSDAQHHRQRLRQLLGDVPHRIRYGRHEDQVEA